MNIQDIIISLFLNGNNEKQIKENLSLLGYSDKEIKKGMNEFLNKYNSINKIYQNL